MQEYPFIILYDDDTEEEARFLPDDESKVCILYMTCFKSTGFYDDEEDGSGTIIRQLKWLGEKPDLTEGEAGPSSTPLEETASRI